MDREVTPERVVQLIALHQDRDGRAEGIITGLDPWEKDEMLAKLLVVTDWVLEKAVEDREVTADEILFDILTTVNGVNDEHS